jgi:RNA polymerase sigma factor for flagellar operon FliA
VGAVGVGDREEAIRSMFPVVRGIARRIGRLVPAADIDDLVGDGCVGLIRAVDTYDAARGATLETYARRLVLGTMLNGLRRLDPISERARRTLREADRERLALAQERGSMPSMCEMEDRTAGLRRARVAAFRLMPLSLEGALGNDGAPDALGDPARIALLAGERREIVDAIRLLPERQRRIVALHYYNTLSLHAIGERMNVSPQRVSQLHLSALARLRTMLAVR